MMQIKKSKTTVLLDKYNEVIIIGNQAEEVYFNSNEESKTRLFKTFKTNLYGDTHNKDIKHIIIKDKITKTNDQNIKISSEIIFVAELKHLRRQYGLIHKNIFTN